MSEIFKETMLVIQNEYPDFLSGKDLVKLNLFPSRFALCNARKQGRTPPDIKAGKQKILYPKQELIKWIKEKGELNVRSSKHQPYQQR